jgi:hypothetical protein
MEYLDIEMAAIKTLSKSSGGWMALSLVIHCKFLAFNVDQSNICSGAVYG